MYSVNLQMSWNVKYTAYSLSIYYCHRPLTNIFAPKCHRTKCQKKKIVYKVADWWEIRHSQFSCHSYTFFLETISNFFPKKSLNGINKVVLYKSKLSISTTIHILNIFAHNIILIIAVIRSLVNFTSWLRSLRLN